jgi:hypothetical protein
MDTHIAATTADNRMPPATANNTAEIPFYLGIPIPESVSVIPMMQQTTCQFQQANGIWVTVIDD